MTDVWKWLATTLGAVMVTGLVAWFSFGGGVSKAEGQELKAKDSAHDARLAVIETNLANQQATLNEVKQNVKEGNAATQDKLDAILLAIPRDSHGPSSRPSR